jgi:hypothetical protein
MKKTFLNFLVKGGGHVTSAAILDFIIFHEEKKDIKKFECQTEIHGQTNK